MTNLKVTWKGTTPLIMHSCKCVNPFHPVAKEMKKINAKKNKKTDEDIERLSDLEWVSGAYFPDEFAKKWLNGEKVKDPQLYIPAENVEATLINGAKSFRKGTDFEKYVSVTDLYIPFAYGETLSLEKLITSAEYRDVRPMRVKQSTVMRTRPRVDQWVISFNLQFDERNIDLETIVQAMEYAGKYVGLCDSRPKYGKFVAVIEELEEAA